jgi:hypothetical protein
MLFEMHERVVACIVPQVAQPTIHNLQLEKIVTTEVSENLVLFHCSEKSPTVSRDFSQSSQLVLGGFLDEIPLFVPKTTKIIINDVQQNLTFLAELWLRECLVSLAIDKLKTDLSEDFAIIWACFGAVPHSDKTLAGVLGIELGPEENTSTKFGARRICLEELFLGWFVGWFGQYLPAREHSSWFDGHHSTLSHLRCAER